MIYDWKSWEEKPLPNVGIARSSMARDLKSFYLVGVNFSWEIVEQSSQENFFLNYKARLSSIEKLEFALVDGLGIAEIKDPNSYEFNQVAQNHGANIFGKIPVAINQVVVFRINNNECFALMPARIENKGVVKGEYREKDNLYIVYEWKLWPEAKPQELVNPIRNEISNGVKTAQSK